MHSGDPPAQVLGTTAYIITRSGLGAVLAEHERNGYAPGVAIPNVMAKLFPGTRVPSRRSISATDLGD